MAEEKVINIEELAQDTHNFNKGTDEGRALRQQPRRRNRRTPRFYPCSGSLSTLILLSLTLQNRVVLYKIERKCVKNDTFT